MGKLQCGFLVRAQGAESGECPFNTHYNFTKSLIFMKVQ